MSKHQPHIKICGLRDVATIESMNGLAVDEVGFVFAPSKRQVLPTQAAPLITAVKRLTTPNGVVPRTVGVFVDATVESLRTVLAEAPLDIVQLHGQESPQVCAAVKREFAVQVWKVFSISAEEHDVTNATENGINRLAAYKEVVDGILIDTVGGGTGKTFAWHVIPRYYAAAQSLGVPLYVAGGLQLDNVAHLLANYVVDGIDVSSGVETEGQKDPAKIKTFIERVTTP